jgi:hypothetical protein
MKKVLIISPYFPPVNAADMHRVRTNLSYFSGYGWEAEVVTVDPAYAEMPEDKFLLKSIPAGLIVHTIKAFNKNWTSVFGLGSIALRSLWFYRRAVNNILRANHFDLIFFSTTQFPVCILGPYWKKRFGVPYIIDMQDPWHSDYYLDKPKNERPPKYWFSYRLNKRLEPIAMKSVDGLVAVSGDYIKDLKSRYPEIKDVPCRTITFGAFEPDMEIAATYHRYFKPLLETGYRNIVYAGRGGADLHKAISPLFTAVQNGLKHFPEVFKRLRFYFIGTSYAPAGQGVPTILPLAQQFGIEGQVIEITDRIAYYHALLTLTQADALFIPGSDDGRYTASKIFPCLLSGKPLLGIFHPDSPIIPVLRGLSITNVYNYIDVTEEDIMQFLSRLAVNKFSVQQINTDAFEVHSAQNKTKQLCRLFDEVIN